MEDCPYEDSTNNYSKNPASKKHSNPSKCIQHTTPSSKPKIKTVQYSYWKKDCSSH